ncbi:complex I subunit 5 family protein [Natranaerofaba carboxydovora]|uniref:complex I subunit 5 family protein n=1 Tax=Natranaerofaba carboxydovora TaxID=2742683 RepID=UPI001F135FFF|nr:proton-conducting transporter membrane subunit [Natranaerofaba carboxydovora]UMZ72860.1 Hydrogenase-4 component B [Natranaerofaba carboxydovora]
MELFQVVEGKVIESMLPIWIVLVPIIASFALIYIGGKSEKIRDIFSSIVSGVTFLMVLGLYPMVSTGTVEFSLGWFLGEGLLFRVDQFSFVLAVLVSLIWFLATLYATDYISHEENRNRFYFFWMMSLGTTLGVFLTGDFFSLFLFFELMTFASYVLVIHEEDDEALRAGNLYIFLGVLGGLAILMGVFLMYSYTGSYEMAPMLEDVADSGINIILLVLIFIFGFGIKAGLVPLHIWLPKAHPVAPTPASALLSGLMIKTGVYGIWRVLMTVLAPSDVSAVPEAAFNTLTSFGGVVIWMGIITMFLGAFMAFLQTSGKKILAYSSVSQIGYIFMGVGAAVYLGFDGPVGFAGAMMHVINHALFKAGLFLVVGAIYIKTHLLDIDRVRGMFKPMPFLGVAFLVFAFGIAGIPLFNGYASKVVLHHAIVDAYSLEGSTALQIAETIFTITSAFTVAYFIKLFRGLFLGRLPEEYKKKDLSVAPIVKVVLAVFIVLVIGIGSFPNFFLEQIVVPGMSTFPQFQADVISEQLIGLNFWDSYDLQKVVLVLAIASCIYILGTATEFVRWRAPYWLSIENVLYRPIVTGFLNASTTLGATFDVTINDFFEQTSRQSMEIAKKVSKLDQGIDETYSKSGERAKDAMEKAGVLDGKIDDFYEESGKRAKGIARTTNQIDGKIDDFYEEGGKRAKGWARATQELDESLDSAYARTAAGLTSAAGVAKGENIEEFQEGSLIYDEEELEKAYSQVGRVSHHVTSRKKLRKRPKSIWEMFGLDASVLNIKNLNFDSFIIALMLGLSLFFLLFYHQFLR